uniref:Large ribosomal subunit protein bL21m n=1 Tax=Cyanoptyche gloeocystis TaxID=77922 RepID=A0A3G1IW89_9EUKA|nr:ribosomal protein L21 [Cyanoptyche gloeocystis]ASQ40332.1 ribosomal protein L21 [Cyanoptyche gloeocystis]|mmetsp:Transcript_9577/g.16526  ORF Transcript_9577/g.16526 Transcript_9577/m.16526 type:complete len:117 (+) Transcript_9577:89-439(+)
MSYAIIEAAGKQIWVEPGRFYDLDLMPVEPYQKISLKRVLLIRDDKLVKIGRPWIQGACVKATILRHLRASKLTVYKMRPKKKTRRKQGHRQELTRIMVNAIMHSAPLNRSIIIQN